MPSERILEEKKKTVEEMTDKLKYKAGVFVDYKGIKVNEDTEMRVKLREANVEYSVVKNTLMRFAIKNIGFDELESILVGTTSLAISNDDPIAPARIIKEYATKLQNYFEIKAGFMDGKLLSVDEVDAIANIPALPVLQAQFLGTLLAPITSLAIVLKAIAEKGGVPADVDVEINAEGTAEVPEEEAPGKEAAEAPAEAAPAKEDAKAPVEDAPEKKAEEAPVEEIPEKKAEEAPVKEDAKAPVEETPKKKAEETPKEKAKAAPGKEAAETPAEEIIEKPKKSAAKKAKPSDKKTAEDEPAKE